ncbi:hypothetical protein [Aquirhabdus sp.]|uniref:hypothetical protein n=1 Tax=Aquirhabdus sp. TaxID=2824160 RepID=UPI00396CC192
MENNLRVAKVHFALSVFYVIFLIIFVLDRFLGHSMESLENKIVDVVAIVMTVTLIGGIHFLISRGAKNKKPWARIASIIVACILLVGIPIGTMIGIYLLKYNRWSKDYNATPLVEGAIE